MSEAPLLPGAPEARQLGPVSYVFATLSIMPLLGFLFGAVAVVIGLLNWQRGGKIVASIGAIGIASQVLVYVALIHSWLGS